MAINDALLSLTEREIKYLKDSWAETFSKKIFPSQKYFEEHNEIIKAIKNKDSKNARNRMYDHLAGVERDLLNE